MQRNQFDSMDFLYYYWLLILELASGFYLHVMSE